MYIKCNVPLEGITATMLVPEMYINDIRRKTLTIRLNPFYDLASYQNNPDNPLNPGMESFQYTYNYSKIDASNWHVQGLLEYIIANESIKWASLVK